MQFDPIAEKCIRNPMEVRKLPEKKKQAMLAFLHKFRMIWRKANSTPRLQMS